MYQQDSYSEFMPMRQSSTLADETLLMNDTDVYANVTVVWPAGHNARELELERVRIEMEALKYGVPYVSMCNTLAATLSNADSLAATLPNNSTSSMENSDDAVNEETVWMTALDISCTETSTDSNEESMYETYHTVLDFTMSHNKVESCKVHSNGDRVKIDINFDHALNDTLSMDDTLPMDDDPMDDDVSLDDSWEIN